MSSNKGGLADLKRLARQAAEQAARPLATSAPVPPGGAPGGRSAHGGAPASSSAPPSAQDLALFRGMAGEVEPVDTRNRLLHTPQPADPMATPAGQAGPSGHSAASRRPSPVARDQASSRPDTGLSDADVSHLLCENGTAFVRPGVGPDVLKKIAQRYWRLEADLDLHGLTIEQARPRLAAFLMQCSAYDARCVRVVHGKGHGSPDALPVLRDKVRAWLVGVSEVRAFAQAPERDGGAGATIVLLKVDDRRARDRRAP